MAWRPDYIDANALKAYMRIDPSDTTDDAEIATVISGASRAIDNHCGRQFGKVDSPEQRVYTAWWHTKRGQWVADIDDLATDMGITVETDAGQITEFDLLPANAVKDGRVYTRIAIRRTSTVQPTGREDELRITAPWGWSAVPAEVVNAAKIQAHRFFVRRVSPFGVAGSPDTGNELRLLARLDPDVAVSLVGLVKVTVR